MGGALFHLHGGSSKGPLYTLDDHCVETTNALPEFRVWTILVVNNNKKRFGLGYANPLRKKGPINVAIGWKTTKEYDNLTTWQTYPYSAARILMGVSQNEGPLTTQKRGIASQVLYI